MVSFLMLLDVIQVFCAMDLGTCPFRHDGILSVSTLKRQNLCTNCLTPQYSHLRERTFVVGDEVAKVPANVAWGRRVLIHVHLERQRYRDLSYRPSVCHVKTGYISKANVAAAQLYQALTMCIVSL